MTNSPLYESSASETEDDRSSILQQSVEVTPTPKPRNKRQASGSPKGDIEGQTHPAAHPSKRPKESHWYSPPWDIEGPPGSRQIPQNAPPVTITNVQGSEIANRAVVGRRLSFGSMDGDTVTMHMNPNLPPNMQPSPVIERRERRQPKPLQKVLYMQEHQTTQRKHVNPSSTHRDAATGREKGQSHSVKGKERSKESSSHVAQAPAYQAPVNQAPVYQAPVYQAPASQAPVYQAPVTQAF